MATEPEQEHKTPQFQYFAGVFDRGTVESAAEIILTPESGITTEQRWVRETPYLAEMYIRDLKIRDLVKGFDFDYRPVVLDYGCGIGRMAVPLMQAGATVIGVDISVSMRKMALEYTEGHGNFVAVSPQMFGDLVVNGLRVDAVMSTWALQHVYDISETVEKIKRAMKPKARIALTNSKKRLVPCLRPQDGNPEVREMLWADDGFNLSVHMGKEFVPVLGRNLNPAKVGDAVAGNSFFGVWEKRSD